MRPRSGSVANCRGERISWQEFAHSWASAVREFLLVTIFNVISVYFDRQYRQNFPGTTAETLNALSMTPDAHTPSQDRTSAATSLLLTPAKKPQPVSAHTAAIGMVLPLQEDVA